MQYTFKRQQIPALRIVVAYVCRMALGERKGNKQFEGEGFGKA